MPLQIRCPHCESTFTVHDHIRGKRVRCKNCQEAFTAKDSSTSDEDDIPTLSEDQIQERPEKPRVPVRRRSPAEERDHRWEREERRSRRDWEDDEEERPRRARRREPMAAPASSKGLVLAGVIGGLLLFAALGAGAVYLLASKGAAPATPVAGGGPGGGDPVAGAGGQPGGGGGAIAGGALPVGQTLRYRWEGSPFVYAVKAEVEREKYFEIHEGNFILRANKGGAGPAVPAGPQKATGTGFVVQADGTLITCAHVVADATKVEVILGGRTYPATVVATEPNHDLAILKIQANNLPTLSLGNSDTTKVGLEVRALGYPLSSVLGDNIKMTRGAISGINTQDGRKVLQTDASINPGNSGGPLVTETGEVIGVNSSKLAGAAVSNVGFATPSNEAKRLLAGRGLSFASGGWNTKLDGVTLVERVSPAVALISVTLGPGAGSNNTFRVTCNGNLGKRQHPKPGIILMPGPPSFGGFGARGTQLDIDATGRVLQATPGTQQLPMLLGDVAQFIIDPLPTDNRPMWEINNTCTIEETTGGGIPVGPRFGPRPGMFGPRMPGFPGGGGPDRTRQGQERIVYTLGARAADAPAETVTINKRYELKVPEGPGDAPRLELAGEGTVQFDNKAGYPRSLEFKGSMTISRGNTSERVPIKVSYTLVTGEAREKILNPPPPPKVEPKPFTEADLTQALSELKGTEVHKKRMALDNLAKAKSTPERREEVTKAIRPLLSEKDNWLKRSAVQALGVWGGKDIVPDLVPLLEDNDFFVRMSTMETLGKIGDERAAGPIAKRLTQLSDRIHAGNALKALGSKAEKALHPYLENSEWSIRLEACRLLKEIGTQASKAALEKAAQDSNRLVASNAKQALQAIAKKP